MLGYVYGNPRNWPFEHWINQSPNVVVVSIYYRLDSLGFLAHPSFSSSASGSNSKPADLNVGFLDQVTALQWVHDNIASFGGDPSRVTINGESAGGSSVVLHMVANAASKQKHLFSGAIAQSIDREILATPEQQEVSCVTRLDILSQRLNAGILAIICSPCSTSSQSKPAAVVRHLLPPHSVAFGRHLLVQLHERRTQSLDCKFTFVQSRMIPKVSNVQ